MFKVKDEYGLIKIVYGVRATDDGGVEFLLFNPIQGIWFWDESCCYTPLQPWVY